MQRKKILIIVESIDVEESSGAKANVALIKNLFKGGFELRVYHYTRKNIQLGGIPCIAIKEKRRSLLFLLSRLERHLRNQFNLDMHKGLEEIFGFSFTLFNDRNSIIAGLKEVINTESDLVLTLSQGGSFRPHHAILKLPELHSKWIAYIHDPYPMHSYPRPYDWVEPGHQKKRDFFLKVATKARYVAYPSKLLGEWMESYFPPLKKKRVIIPHQIGEKSGRESTLPNFFKKDAFNIVHAGALMSARNPLHLLTAYRQFLKKFPGATNHSQLLFLGPRSKYSREFSNIGKELPQFFFSDCNLPFATVLGVQRHASVNVILEAKGPVSPFLPGKFPHCVAANKPILLLGPHYSECRRLLGHDYPYFAEIDEVEKMTSYIAELYELWLAGKKLQLNRPDLVDYLSHKRLKETLHNLN